MISRYFIRPKADQDLEDQAYYLATHASPEVGHRFLVAAHETFKLLATQPGIGWQPRLRVPKLTSLRVFPVSGFKKMLPGVAKNRNPSRDSRFAESQGATAA